jgi:hypothetical protein
MSVINKPLLRLAVAIRSELATRSGRRRGIELPLWSWERCVELVRQIRRAEMRGWHLAAQELRRDLAYTIPPLQSELTSLASQLPHSSTTEPINLSAIGDIYNDLLALENEFDELEFDMQDRWLSVTTEPIALQNVYLGPFEIRLEWAGAGEEPDYRVIAKEPHPPESRESVTHPHVMDERLCEGHSRQAIHQAIAQGRLLDFFTLVANGLRTYNEESPFLSLEIWYGQSCSDCGAIVDEDDRYVCQRCEETICEGCEITCCGCDDSCCSGCITGCAACDDNYCRSCLRPCSTCAESVCVGCLATVEMAPDEAVGKTLARQVLNYPIGMRVHAVMLREFRNRSIQSVAVNDERCINCHENERQEREKIAAAEAERTAVQPHLLGQALVPA